MYNRRIKRGVVKQMKLKQNLIEFFSIWVNFIYTSI
jgi:hypothetical protein